MVNSTTEWLGLITAIIITAGLIWRKVIKPICLAWRWVKLSIERVLESVELVEQQMKPNSGATLFDKAEQGKQERRQIASDVTAIKANVSMLLAHDRERDQPGKRYGEIESGDTS